MPTASVRAVRIGIRLNGGIKAREFQKIQVKNWLNENLKNVPLSDNL